MPTRPVTLDEADLSKYGPVPGVGTSRKKSSRNLRFFGVPVTEKRILIKISRINITRGLISNNERKKGNIYIYVKVEDHVIQYFKNISK